jgi:O-antigen/teichoic acid export membrane protein
MAGHIASQILRLVSNLLMTRLLVPEMFGVMALANVIMVGLQMLSDFGLWQGIVQSRRGAEPAYLNTIWTVQILRGILLWLFALGIAGTVRLGADWGYVAKESVYADPVLPSVIAVLGITALLGGLVSTRLATASRDLALGRKTLVELACQILSLGVMVGWALIDRSIWALVGGAVVGSALRVLASHIMLPGQRNKLHWDPVAFREIFGFGKWIFLTSILGFLSANGDRLLLGGLVDTATLGIYAIAFFLVSALAEVVQGIAGGVAFPALSEVVRDRPAELKQIYYRFRLPVDVVALIAMGGLISAGHLVVELLYDERYHAAGEMIAILAVSLFEVRYTVAGQCFLALGRPRLLAPAAALRVVLMFGLMPATYSLLGIEGAVWVVSGSILLTLPIVLYFKVVNGLFDMRRELVLLPLIGVGYCVGGFIDSLAQTWAALLH